jgi:uncharacterized protein YbaR (Trm112 family)
MNAADAGTLACPECHARLTFDGTVVDGQLDQGVLRCARCGPRWPVRDGLPHLVDEARVQRADRFMRLLYDWLAPLHDPLTRVLFPRFDSASPNVIADFARGMI